MEFPNYYYIQPIKARDERYRPIKAAMQKPRGQFRAVVWPAARSIFAEYTIILKK